MANNLSHLGVRAFAQDSLGNMWIATLAGLDRYNGYEFEHFVHIPGDEHTIRNDFVFSLLADGDLIWIGTAYGVDRYNVRSGQITRVPGAQTPAYQLYKDRAGRLRVSSVWGLGTLDAAQDSIIYRNDLGAVNQVWEDSYNRLWLGTDRGLVREEGAILYNLPGNRKVRCCYMDSQGQWWLGTDSGIVLFDPVTGSCRTPDGPVSTEAALQSDQINFICEVAPMQLLIGTAWDGVWFYDIVSQSLSHNQPSKYNPGPSAELNCCYLDKQGNAWIGTYDRGFIVAGKQSDLFNEDKALSKPLENKFVTRVVEDGSGNLWIATRYDGLYRYSPSGRLEKIDISAVQPSGGDYLEGVFVDSHDRLWLFFEGQLSLARALGGKAQKMATFPLVHVRCIKEDSSGNIWIGAWNGMYQFGDNTPQPVKVENNNVVNISDILPLKDGRILFSSYAWDVFYLKDDDLYQTDIPDEGRDMIHNVITMAQDLRGRIWLGSYGYGLLCWDGDKVLRLTSADGLPDNNILSFQQDFSGSMWVSTFHGIARISLQDDLQDAEIQVFPGLQYHEKSGCRSSDGLVFFGGNHGLTFFDPKSLSATRQCPTIHLEDLKIWGQSVRPAPKGSVLKQTLAYTDRISLDHRQRSFAIDFAGNDFFSSNNLTYKYRLKGFDKDWVDAGTYRRASYSNLHPGDYTFEAVAIGEDGVESPDPARLQIHVKQVPWFSWWAILLYLLLFSLLAWLLLRSAMNARLARERAELERSEKEREREMSNMKTVFFTNISHELRTPLTLITAPLEKLLAKPGQDENTTSLLEGIHRNSSRMMMLINQLMDFSKIENGVYSLGVKYADVIPILHETFSSFSFVAEKKGISLSFAPHRPSEYMWVDEDKIVKILDNLLSNALKHTPPGGIVEVRTAAVDDAGIYGLEDGRYLEISVLDTGRGVPEDKLDELFVRYRKIEGRDGRRPDYSGNGIGLHYTKNMVEKHHGKITARLRPTGGMNFSFVLPLDDVYAEGEKVLGEVAPQPAITPKAESLETASSGERTVLVVEDNAELRDFLVGLLNEQYHVLEAADGAKAWQMLQDNQPELVVSDVIMPGLSGYELCAKIKESQRLCHILVILLTAKTSHEEQIEGLESGADAYICKPFHADFLLRTIQNLLHTKDVLKQYFTLPSYAAGAVSEMDLPETDKAFLEKLTSIMEANLANPDLNVDLIARQMGYSRTAFYLKVKRLTGTAPNDMVLAYRFKAAAEAIRGTRTSLSDIAEKTGFGSYSYFSKAFKKHFGVSPKEYRIKE
ncbi:MAG: response regulator [Bacteroidales bacterium]|nr:response regulator [Bacteroidales bacterium]